MLLISCNKDETYLMDYFDGQPTATTHANAPNDVEAASVSTCECQYRIYSMTGTPSSGNHLEMYAHTWQNTCSPGCPWALGYYGCYYNSVWGSNVCSNNMDAGLFTFPTKWIPFNCSIPNADFKKKLYLNQITSGCSFVPGGVSDGEIVYGIRCKGSCSTDWEYSASTIIDVPSSVTTFDIEMGGDCGCLPTIVN